MNEQIITNQDMLDSRAPMQSGGIVRRLYWRQAMAQDMKTLPLGLAYFLGQYTIYWNLLMVGATIALLPVLIVFFFAQRYFIEGITLTGLKG